MILYHGSYCAIESPNLSFCRNRTDFGRGFYLTPVHEQAVNWSKHLSKEGKHGIVSVYGFLQKPAVDKLPDDLRILEFDTHSREWLDFITDCRLGQSQNAKNWDLVIGGVANDKVFDTLQLYFDGIIEANETIKRLRYNKPNFQYCFKNQPLIDNYLEYLSAEEV
ncbi:MAG: DUF3990 domain-containing protein [Termitinemataceae bacterium]|nr:MAG: DUF3990 domain-containing protein [Termitinemataceae bacterium]